MIDMNYFQEQESCEESSLQCAQECGKSMILIFITYINDDQNRDTEAIPPGGGNIW